MCMLPRPSSDSHQSSSSESFHCTCLFCNGVILVFYESGSSGRDEKGGMNNSAEEGSPVVVVNSVILQRGLMTTVDSLELWFRHLMAGPNALFLK